MFLVASQEVSHILIVTCLEENATEVINPRLLGETFEEYKGWGMNIDMGVIMCLM